MTVVGALPTGTVTLLMTDVEGSTRLWEADEDVAAAAMARHHELLAAAVTLHGGVRPVEQGEGDSVVAAFTKPSDALMAALDVQRAFLEASSTGTATVRIRMALHTGEIELRDGGNYQGPTIIRCARLRNAAHGAQTVLSGTTHDLVVDRLPDDVTLRDLGAHRFKGLGRAERVWQLCHPDIEDVFPPLRSLDALPNNLPLQLTSFVGRDHELAHVVALLDKNRLVTLTGAGGTGKTRLALQSAAEVLDRYPDGVWFVDLAAVSDPALVPVSTAIACGFGEVPLQSVEETLVERLAACELLLVIDNCEHLIAACSALVERLVTRCPGLTGLATSREPLGVAGEVCYPVPSLEGPDSESDAQCEAVQLFTARASAARPAFRLTPQSLPAVTGICRRLDGIPLAIELAAARCRALTPTQIARQLEDHFELLSGGSRSALARQRTLEASVMWSIDLLDVEEHRLLERLSVFAGGFTLEAAESVSTGKDLDAWRVVDVLTSLVDKSLVRLDDDDEHIRYRLLETIRYFAAQRLVDERDALGTRARHAAYYVEFVEAVAPDLYGAGIGDALAMLDAEIDNIRAADDWLIRRDDVDRALRLCAALRLYWARRARAEALERARRALALDGGDPNVRIRALLVAAELAWFLGDIAGMLEVTGAAERITDAIADDEMRGAVRNMRAWAAMSSGDIEAIALFEEALPLLRRHSHPYWVADCLAGLGMCLLQNGKCADAEAALSEAVDTAQRSGNPVALSQALALHAHVLMVMGRLDQAEALLVRAEPVTRAVGDMLEPLVDSERAWIDLMRGDYDGAIARSDRAFEVAQRMGTVITVAWARWVRILAIHRSQAPGAPSAAIEEVEGLMELLGLSWGTADCLAMRAEHTLADGELAAAARLADEAAAHAEHRCYARNMLARCLLAVARVQRASGDPQAAEQTAYRALATARAAAMDPPTIDALEAVATLATDQQGYEEAGRLVGATTQARLVLDIPLPPAYQPEQAATIAVLRTQLGAERYGALVGEGASLTLAEAVRYATVVANANDRQPGGRASPRPNAR